MGADTDIGFAPAKINLFLHVGAPRADGYHPLCSLVTFADVGDHVHAFPADDLSLHISGPEGAVLDDTPNNLVLRAARALQAATRPPQGAALHLNKVLPVAAGLGGGSADAAATLRVLNRLWGTGLGLHDLMQIGSTLGADVPVCIASQTAWMTGHGTEITPCSVPDIAAVLVNPRHAVPTAQVFRTFDQIGMFTPTSALTPPMAADPMALLAASRNDLEDAAVATAPVIAQVVATLRAHPLASVVRMCGSGASVYALCNDPAAAQQLARDVRAIHPTWWVQATGLKNFSLHSVRTAVRC